MGDKRMENTMNQAVDFDLSLSKKKRIRIDGDDNRVIELNTSDMGIIERIDNLADKMNELSTEYIDTKFDDNLDEREETKEIISRIKGIDSKMREIVDDLFQSKISDICVPDGTMFDMFNGQFMYEILIEKLLTLYADRIGEETQKTLTRMRKYTDKYIPQDHKKKS